MRILVVTPGFPCEGRDDFAGKFVLNEALAYAHNGAEVRVITPHYPGAPLHEKRHPKLDVFRFRYFWPVRLERLRTPTEPLYARRTFWIIVQAPFLLLASVFQIFKHARRTELIHCQWTVTTLLCLPAKWLMGRKIVVTARGSDIRLFPKWINRFVHASVDAAIDCYGEQKWNKEYKANFPARYLKLPAIVRCVSPGDIPSDLNEAMGGRTDLFKIYFVSRLNREYFKMFGHPGFALLHAAKKLKVKGAKFHLFYIGDGDEETKSEIVEALKENCLEDVVTLLGPKSNLEEYLPFCDLGSGGSAFSGISQEFSCYGKPQLLVRGKDNVGTPWKHKVNALFFTENDHASITEAIEYAMADPVRLKEIAENARRMMSQYAADLADGGAAYLEAFRKLL
jgi:glycosyltransferase involved in cell wall biosynthesis